MYIGSLVSVSSAHRGDISELRCVPYGTEMLQDSAQPVSQVTLGDSLGPRKNQLYIINMVSILYL